MKLLILLMVFAVLELSISIPVENAEAESNKLSQASKIFPESALIPDIRTYKNRSSIAIKHGVMNSNADAKEYFFLSDSAGNVTIIDTVSYEEVISYYLPELAFTISAIVGDTFFNIITQEGGIFSTAIRNIMEGPSNINWVHVGSFPPESDWIRSNPAIDGSLIYFVTHGGNLYSYDTISRLVTKAGKVEQSSGPYASLASVNRILYIYRYRYFHSFDGTTMNSLTAPDQRLFAGLFQMGNKICAVGGNNTDVYSDAVYCYNPQGGEWSTPNYINEFRWFPGVATTELKTYVFGGLANSASSYFWRNSVEVLNHETNIWSFAPTPLTEGQQFIQALIFYF